MKYEVGSCIDSRDGSLRNNLVIPYRIYGYKISGKYPPEPSEPSEPDNNAQNNIYSYDEVRIGTWIDGKPLYRKMFDFGTYNGGGDIGGYTNDLWWYVEAYRETFGGNGSASIQFIAV